MTYAHKDPDEVYLKSFLLKREVKLSELENLAQDELEYIMAEAKAITKESEAFRERKFVANIFYELAAIKILARERRDKDDNK